MYLHPLPITIIYANFVLMMNEPNKEDESPGKLLYMVFHPDMFQYMRLFWLHKTLLVVFFPLILQFVDMFSNTVGQKKLSVCMGLTDYRDVLMVCRMWREIRLLAASKPVIASMSDVAASGGYYMAMAADAIVAENLTLTGSIGVVTGEFEYIFYN